MKILPKYCWDSCIFEGWLKDERRRSPKEKAICTSPDFAAVLEEIDKKECILVVPVIMYVEVLEYHHDAAAMKTLRDFLRRTNIHIVNVTITLAESASKYRSLGLAESPKRKLKTPDALILAAAHEAQANMLHTTDPDLLAIDRHPTSKGMHICEPRTLTGQSAMPLE